MTEFERVLQECLLTLERGDSSVDECLRRHPAHALQLEPILLTGVYLERGREARPSTAFKARVRSRLVREMQAHPRKTGRSSFVFMRLATGLAVAVLLFLTAGTIYAQGALPGSAFHAWKLASETVWRAVSPDPLGTDLAIAERRAEELIAVAHDPLWRTRAMEAYLEVVARLESEMNADNEARIRLMLELQIEELNRSGIILPQLEQDFLPAPEEPSAIPRMSPGGSTEVPEVSPTVPIPAATEIPIQETDQADPTDSPELLPTLQVPTIEVPSVLP